MALYHAYSQTVADGTATSVVRPSDWNSGHIIQQAISGNTSGVSTVSGTNVVYQAGNNVTLSAAQGANAATIVISGANTVAQTVQTQAAGNIAGTGFATTTTNGVVIVGTNATNGHTLAVPPYITTYVNDLTSGRAGTGFTSTTTAGTAVVGTLNTNGLSVGVPAFITTWTVPTQSTQPVAISGSNGSFNFSTLTLGSSNGMHFYTTNGSVVGSYTVPTQSVQTQASGNIAGSGFTSTTATAVAGTLNSAGLLLAVPQINFGDSNGFSFVSTAGSIVGSYTVPTQTVDTNKAGTGFTSTTTAGTAVVATLNTNGLSMGIPQYLTAAGGGAQSVAVSGSNGSFNFSTLTLGSSNGMHFYTTNGSVVGSYTVPTQSVQTQASGNIAGSGFATTTTNGSVVVGTHNSNGMTLAVPPYLTAAAGGAQSVAVSGSNGSFNFSTLTLGSSNGMHFYSTNGSIVGSYTVPTQTVDTNKAGTGFTSTTTTGTAVVGTNDTNGLSLGVPAFITTAANSNNTIAIQIQGGNSSSGPSGYLTITGGTLNLAGSYGITLSQNSNSITISNRANFLAASNTTFTTGRVDFQNLNGISFGTSAGQQINITHDLQYSSNTSNITAAAFPSANTTKFAGTGTTFAGNNITGAMTLDSNGLNLALTGNAAGGGAQSVAVSGSNGSFNFSTLTMGSSNGMHFYTTNGSIVGSYTVPTQSVQTQASGNIVGSGFATTTTNGSVVVGTLNSNGQTLAVPPYLTTAAVSTHSHNFATTTTNGSLIVVATTNSAGATIAVPPFITTAAAQSNQTGNFYVSGNTTQLSSTAGLDLRSISFEGAGIASVGVSNGRVLVSVPSGGGAGDGVNILQMRTDAGNTAGATFSTISGTMYLQGGNNVTLSQTSNTIVISGGAGGGGATVGGWEPMPAGNNSTFSSLGQNSLYMQKLVPEQNYSFNNFELRASVSSASSSVAVTNAYTINYGLYSLNTANNSYSSIATSQMIISASYSSNLSMGYTISQGAASFTTSSAGTVIGSQMTGFKHLYLPFTSTLTAGGNYAFALLISSNSTGGSNANRIAIWNQSVINNLTIGKLYATTLLASNSTYVGDYNQGVYGTTTGAFPAAVAQSQLTNAISQQRLYIQLEV